jgi:choline dehydrogenase-like flavoprotein
MSDYVIVGAGSAGCALAARLTEDPSVTVTLVEAGGADTAEEIHIPACFGVLMKSRFDWDLETDPEGQLQGRKVYLPRGRVLGGSSSINAMIYIRGNRADWDGYAAAGAAGWGYDDVLPYFRRMEDNERGGDEFHGTGGPLAVSEGRSETEIMRAWVAAAQEAGLPANDDFNGAAQEGAGPYQVTQAGGRRCSTAAGYLRPASSRPNLEVLTNAQATGLILEGDRAVGVTVQQGDELRELRADREVIVSAGAYGSPHLLLLSGIGPAAELAALGIECVSDLPVGENLSDHPMSAVAAWTDSESLLTAQAPEHLQRFVAEGRGPLTSNFAEAGGFWHTRPGLEAPDIQFHAAPALFIQEGLASVTDHAWVSSACLLTPTSRGKVSLRSPVASAKPRIHHNYLATPEDRETMIAGVRKAMEIAEQPALAPHFRARHETWWPASSSDADIWEHITRTTQSLYHPVGTCAIGSVVDSELRVHGVEGLRVVDASVLPAVTRGNTNAPAIVVAERAADLIAGRAPVAADAAVA